MASSDGSIVLSVTVDTSELDNAMDSITGGEKVTSGFGDSIEDVDGNVNAVGDSLKNLGKTVAKVFATKKVFDFSKESSDMASQYEANVKRMDMLYGESSGVVKSFVEENASAFGMSKTAAYEAAADYGNIFTTFTDEAQAAELTNEMLEATAVIASQTGRTYDEVFDKIRSGLYGNTRAIDDLGISVRQSQLMQTEAYENVSDGRSWNELTDAELQQARALGILEQANEHYDDGIMESTTLTKSQFQSAWDDFKTEWGSFENDYLAPVLEFLTNVIERATEGIKKIKELAEAKKEGEGEGENGEGDGDADVEGTSNEKTNELLAVAGVCVVAGIMLLLFGHPLYGVALIGMGISEFVDEAEEDGDAVITAIEDFCKDNVDLILAIASICIIVGILLICFGGEASKTQMFRGIALVSLGIAAYIYEAVLHKDEIINAIKDFLAENCEALLGLAALCVVMGVLLIITGTIWYGIGLVAAGIAIFIAEAVTNGEAMLEAIENFFKENWKVLSALAAMLVVIGILLIMAGLIPKGIGAIAVGIATLVAVIVFNFDAIKEKIKGFLTAIKDFILTYGKLVLGIIMCGCIVGIPFGLKLISEWLQENYGKFEFAKVIVDKVKEVWKAVKEYWDKHIAKYFKAQWWSELFKTGLNGAIGIIEKFINKVTSGFRGLVNGALGGITNIAEKVGYDIDLPKLEEIKIPRLAKGAVIPANREFLAVLGDQKSGTNIEAPAALIKQMTMEAIAEQGMSSNQLMLEIANRLFNYQDGILTLLSTITKDNSEKQVVKEEHYNLNKQELMKTVYSLCQGGERLQGNSLVNLNNRVIVKTRKI